MLVPRCCRCLGFFVPLWGHSWRHRCHQDQVCHLCACSRPLVGTLLWGFAVGKRLLLCWGHGGDIREWHLAWPARTLGCSQLGLRGFCGVSVSPPALRVTPQAQQPRGRLLHNKEVTPKGAFGVPKTPLSRFLRDTGQSWGDP